jgi:HK97 family phage prohead protease
VKEIRVCEIRAEAPAGAESLVLEGMPIVYDQATNINDPAGRFTEIIRRGALDGADVSDVRLLYNHDLSKVPLARTPKTMRLELTPAGLRMTANLPDTEEARSVHTAVERGDLSGMSFAFKVPAGGDKYNPATRTREIFKIGKVLECSVVPFPAYPQTSVEARAAIQQTDASRTQALIACNKILIKEV